MAAKEQRSRWIRGALCLLLLAGLGACSGKGGGSGEASPEQGKLERVLETLPVLFPTVPIVLGEDGRVAKVAGFPSKTIDALAEDLTGNPLFGRIVYLDQETLEWLDERDIQHLTVALQPDGAFLLVNGMPLPSVAWGDGSLDNLVDLLGKLRDDGSTAYHLVSDDAYQAIAQLVPVVSKLNLQIDIHLPDLPQAGPRSREEIPTPSRRLLRALAIRQADAADEPGEQQLDLTLRYEAVKQGGKVDGWVPSFAGFSTVDLQRMLRSMDLGETAAPKIPRLMLRRDLQRRLAMEGISEAGLELREDGLYVAVNGKQLPHLAWDEDRLSNLSRLLVQLYPEDEALPDSALWVPALRDGAPSFNDYEVRLRVGFPVQ